MQKSCVAHGADLAIAEKAAQRDAVNVLGEKLRVEVGLLVESRTPSHTGKH